MKKILALSLIALVFLSGCATSNTANQAPSMAKETKTIEFHGTGDYKDLKPRSYRAIFLRQPFLPTLWAINLT